jgi:DNA-binding CsgD family transcriptional regulator
LQLLRGEPSVIHPVIVATRGQWPPSTWTLWLAGRETIDAGEPALAVDGARTWGGPMPHSQAVLAAVEAAARCDEDRWHDALAIALDQGLRLIAVDALEGLAVASATSESWAECLRLVAAANRLRDETGYRWRFGFEQRAVDSARAAAISGLADGAETASTEGNGLDWREAAAYARRARGQRKRPSHGWLSLTPTEQQVVALVVDGLTNPEIAERLLMGRATVKTHLSHIFTKLDVRTRAQLASEVVLHAASGSNR